MSDDPFPPELIREIEEEYPTAIAFRVAKLQDERGELQPDPEHLFTRMLDAF